jgi:hypothetical protein
MPVPTSQLIEWGSDNLIYVLSETTRVLRIEENFPN